MREALDTPLSRDGPPTERASRKNFAQARVVQHCGVTHYSTAIHVERVNVDGTGLLRLTNHAGRDKDPAWSPDGKRIAFTSDRAGSSDIYVMNADGSNLLRRTQTGSSEAPAWSPDGTKIAFSSLRGGEFGIYVMSVDGDWANPTRVGHKVRSQ
jgi:dipeptidyl aminopeptidase/acylaminoacyl peptidase